MAEIEADITPEILSTWWMPNEAAGYVSALMQEEATKETGRAIWECVVGGIIKTACSHMSRAALGHNPSIIKGPLLIPTRYWSHFQSQGSSFWNGYVKFLFPPEVYTSAPVTVRCFGIRLDPDDVRAAFPSLPAAPPEPKKEPPPVVSVGAAARSANRGGRPPKEWWDHLWVEILRQIYVGDLQPKRQVDIENAMSEWVFARGGSASERSIRDAAHKLWKAVFERGKN